MIIGILTTVFIIGFGAWLWWEIKIAPIADDEGNIIKEDKEAK